MQRPYSVLRLIATWHHAGQEDRVGTRDTFQNETLVD